MQTTPSGAASFTLALENEEATRRFAVDLANILEPGDWLALSGDLGAGKTTLVRTVLGYLAGDESLEVPSPAFTLVQTYELPRFTFVHADLYRLTAATDLAELGLDEVPDAVTAIEWPDRAGQMPADRIEVALTVPPRSSPDARVARVSGHGAARERVERLRALIGFLEEAGYDKASRTRIAGDASTRSYARLTAGGKSFILMNAPRRADGPPLKRGLSYSALAHLAEDVKPFVAIANALRGRGFSAPRIFAADYDAGFLVIEDFGSEALVAGDPPRPIVERYERATDLLVELHRRELPDRIAISPKVEYRIPAYDLDAFLVEVELLLDWYLPHRNAAASPQARALFLSRWREALRPALDTPKTWVLRDYHSPNLLWLNERSGIAAVGLLDFQDALMGPAAYDLASLLQDARIDVPEELEAALFARYVRGRRAVESTFEADPFALLYATLAGQRATKILGIFARLDRRDGKPHYLRHMPRVYAGLRRALTHPALKALDQWYLANVPPP
jgi:N-acetylmuramate 1-kinase